MRIRSESAGQAPQVLDTHNLQEHGKDSEMMCKCFPAVFLNLHSHTYIADVTQAPALNNIASEVASESTTKAILWIHWSSSSALPQNHQTQPNQPLMSSLHKTSLTMIL